LTGAAVVLLFTSTLLAHCEIPCGIYDDAMRIQMIDEHIRTIEKSIQEIHKLQEAKDTNDNQLVRWIMNKENHADQLTEIVTQYFMTQRITPAAASDTKAHQEYIHKLTLLHKMMVNAMKCKQTTDLAHIATLRELLAAFKTAYFGEIDLAAHQAAHEHGHSH
jgi:nickel superoxide dismutase